MEIMKFEINKGSTRRVEIIDITHDINEIVKECRINEGVINIFAVHSTTGIVINENESRLINDFQNSLEKLIPENNNYGHDQIDNNADSHIRAFFIGNSETIPFSDNLLSLGRWQSVFFVELDGPRNRKFIVTAMGK